jgi:hypothetical protein
LFILPGVWFPFSHLKGPFPLKKLFHGQKIFRKENIIVKVEHFSDGKFVSAIHILQVEMALYFRDHGKLTDVTISI